MTFPYGIWILLTAWASVQLAGASVMLTISAVFWVLLAVVVYDARRAQSAVMSA